MNVIYAKTILYAYAGMEKTIEQIDELVEKGALASFNDFTPCLAQCEKIIELIFQKDTLAVLKRTVDVVLKRFDLDELKYFDYKYFKKKPRSFYKDFDASGRAYFRKQVKLAALFAERLERLGVDDAWFEEYCLKTDYFKELFSKVKELEVKSKKNKPKAEKLARKNALLLSSSGAEAHVRKSESPARLSSSGGHKSSCAQSGGATRNTG